MDLMAKLWSYLWVVPMIALSTAGHGLVSHFASLFDSSGHTQLRVARVWARSLLWIARVHVEVKGLDRVRGDVNYVFTANHLSYMDTPVVLAYVPARFRFLAKEELFKIPFLGWHLTRAGHIPVPLDDPRARIRTLNQAADLIHRQGISLLIFPEGGRSEDGELQDFKGGAAYFAIKAQVPLVPMALVGTRRILPMHSLIFRRGRVKLVIGQPISTEGMTIPQRGELSDMIRAQIAGMLDAHPAAAGDDVRGRASGGS